MERPHVESSLHRGKQKEYKKRVKDLAMKKFMEPKSYDKHYLNRLEKVMKKG